MHIRLPGGPILPAGQAGPVQSLIPQESQFTPLPAVPVPPPPPPPPPVLSPGLPPSPASSPNANGPPLPPRPAGGPSRLTAASNLSFPPPPSSPNRPPDLPPRPQQQQQQLYGQQSYGSPVHPQPYAPYPPTHTQASFAQPEYGQSDNTLLTQIPPPPPPPPLPPQPSPSQHEQSGYAVSPPQALPFVVPIPSQHTTAATPASNPPPYDWVPASQPLLQPQMKTETEVPQRSTFPSQTSDTSYATPVDVSSDQTQSSVVQPQSTIAENMTLVDSMLNSLTLLPPHMTGPDGNVNQPATEATENERHTLPATTPVMQPWSSQAPSSIERVQLKPTPPSAVAHCLSHNVKFTTTWYVHQEAPNGLVCSKCYVEHIWPTQFRSYFEPRSWSDGMPRRCRFSSPRIQDNLLPTAVKTGSLQPLLDFFTYRYPILDCAGKGGSGGGQGVKWFRPAQGAINGMVVCEACYQDNVASSSLEPYFESAPAQPNKETWVCGLSIPHIFKEFKECKKTANWARFVQEATARIGMPACAQSTAVMRSSRKWFAPKEGPKDTLICVACYCDRVLQSEGQPEKWQEANTTFGPSTLTCILGQYSVIIAMSCAEENKDWSIFWRALKALSSDEPLCSPNGTKTTRWFTFPTQPPGFQICGACRAGVLEPLGIASYFVPSVNPPGADVATVCSMNNKDSRFAVYAEKMQELYDTHNPGPWQEYASKYSTVPHCPRDLDISGRNWYGWPDCVICHECYLDFVEGTALDDASLMPLRGVPMSNAQICDMYSPRMRNLYTAACEKSPPDATELREYSTKRREVYWQTIPICRRMLVEQKFIASQANMKMIQGSLYTSLGQMQAINHMGTGYSYSQAGVGYGFGTQNELDGARYSQQGSALASQASNGNRALLAGQLERQWRAVE